VTDLTGSVAMEGAAPGGGHGEPPGSSVNGGGVSAALGFGQRKVGSQTLNS
jgi:hypothetical protein